MARTRPGRISRPFSADELMRIGKDISAQWFHPVEASSLTLMEIDPWNVHAYWNIGADDLAAARADLPVQGGDAALVLRFTDTSPQREGMAPHDAFDVEVHQASNNWYVNLWRDAWHYSAELGLRAADGAFAPLLRSNEVTAPRAGPSPELDFRELEVRSPRLAESGWAPDEPDVGDLLLRDLFPKRLLPDDDFPLANAEADNAGAVLDEPEFPILDGEADDIDDSDLLQQLAADEEELGIGAALGTREPSGHFPFIAAAEIEPYHDLAKQTKRQVLAGAPSPLPPLPPLTLELGPAGLDLSPQPLPIPPASERNGTIVGGSSGAPAGSAPVGGAASGAPASATGAGAPPPAAVEPQPLPAPSAAERNGATAGGPGNAPDGGAPPPAALRAASIGRPPVPLEALLADAVFSAGRDDAPAVAAAHVVIEGQAAPDTPLTLFGKPVRLRADNSFTLRLPLRRGPELAALLHHLRARYGEWGEG